jgi:hypothetical protein
MILFVILMLINCTVPNKVLFDYRFDMGGFPVNALDVMLILLFAQQLLSSGRDRFQTERVHPLLYWSIGLLVTAIFFGIAGAAIGGTGVRQYVTALRNLATLPAAIFIGYSLLNKPARVKPVIYIWVFGSVASALALLFLVRESSEMVAQGRSFDVLRVIRYGGDTGLAAAGLLAFALVSRLRLLPKVAMLGLFLVAVVGVFAPPHRGGYVIAALTLAASTLVLPRVPVGRRAGVAVVGLVVIGSTLLSGAIIMSRITGRDFEKYVVEKRLKQLVPWLDEETKVTVTGTRLPGIIAELNLWLESPLIGNGFAVSTRIEAEEGEMGMNHNVWTSSLAQYGPVGLFAFAVPVIGCMVVGFRLSRTDTDGYMSILGVLATIVALDAFLWATITMSINTQRLAMLVGLMFGMTFRCRAMQLTLARMRAEQEYQAGYEMVDYERFDSVHLA